MALEQKLTGCEIDGKAVIPKSKDNHLENRDGQKYPAITFFRMDKQYDVSRFLNDMQLLFSTDDEGLDIINTYSPLNPYNFLYQVETLAKECYDADMLELFIDEAINPRGDMVSIESHIIDTNEDKIIKFPLFVTQKIPDDNFEDNKNVYYRTIYTMRMQVVVDVSVLKAVSYTIKHELSLENKNK